MITAAAAPTIVLGSRRVGPGEPCLLIGEAGLAHDGSLDAAHAFIDAIASAGFDAVKFQTHLAEAESTPSEPFRVPMGTRDATRYDYWKRTAFTEAQWRELAGHARQQELVFLSSPFSVEAVDWLARVGVPAWKVASGQINDRPMLERMAATGLPVLFSTGMSPWAEIDGAVHWAQERRLPHAVFQTTSLYPTPADKAGLNLVAAFRQRYGCPVGLSDHSGTPWPGLAAAALGIDLLEVHVTLHEGAGGVDAPVSLALEALRRLAEGVRCIERMRAHPVDKDQLAQELLPMRRIFTKSLVARVDLPAGCILSAEHLAARKPGTGLAPERLAELLGRRVRKPVRMNELLREEDLEESRGAATP